MSPTSRSRRAVKPARVIRRKPGTSRPERSTIFITQDPLEGAPLGATITVEPYTVKVGNVTAAPESTKSWSQVHGTILAVGVFERGEHHLIGTAVMVGLGIAVTATHILDTQMDSILRGDTIAYLLGMGHPRGFYWQIQHVSCSSEDDVTFLSVGLRSPLPASGIFRALPMTTREPAIGEVVTILGYRTESGPFREDAMPDLGGAIYGASGPVVAVHPIGRDRVFARGPAFEIACDALPSMSGGAALDSSGKLLGIVSSSLAVPGEVGQTVVAMVAHTLGREILSSWPPGMVGSNSRFLDLATTVMPVEGAEQVTILDDGRVQLRRWNSTDGRFQMLPPA